MNIKSNTRFLPYDEAKKVVHSFNFKHTKDWKNYCKLDNKLGNIPSSPNTVYKNKGWISYGDWLGTNKLASKYINFLSFIEAKKIIHLLKIKGQKEWRDYCRSGKKPNNIPANPHDSYKNKGWISVGDWLGTNKIADQYLEYLSFEDAKKIVHKLQLKSQKEWKDYCKSGKKPNNIPSSSWHVYKNKGWISLGDWLGTNKIAPKLKKYPSFEDAKIFIHNVNLKNHADWKCYCKSGKKPDSIPAAPSRTYKNKGWISWSDWFGTKPGFTGEFISYDKAKEFVHSLKLKNRKEWFKYCKSGKKPYNIPVRPYIIYKDKGWKSMEDWIGTKPGFAGFLLFEEARKFVHSLNLKNGIKWRKYCKSGNKPNNIPASPWHVYKNKGWINVGDWLGTNKKWISFEDAKGILKKIKLS